MRHTFYEFFAGGGMVSVGLGRRWQCLFANDFDQLKAAAYIENHGDDAFRFGDVTKLKSEELPGQADLAWASFPCQDLSLAGNGRGLNGERSGTFWHFCKLVRGLKKEGRAPKIIALENVVGTLSSNGGDDFRAIVNALSTLGYASGSLIIDAAHFVPQSRPRLFVIAVRRDLTIPAAILRKEPSELWSNSSLLKANSSCKASSLSVNWDLPPPPRRNARFSDIVEPQPNGVSWRTQSDTKKLLSLMDETNSRKVRQAKKSGERSVGTVYRRTRPDGHGGKVQRAEVRFDEIAGCLRTPTGGSSRQILLEVNGNKVRSRLLSPREAARLMGLPEEYKLPSNYNAAYHLLGDGVVAPIVRHLSEQIFEPILSANIRLMAAE